MKRKSAGKTARQNPTVPTLSPAEEELLQECSDVLDELSSADSAYPETVIAFALRANLANALNSILAMETWTPGQISGFIDGLKEDVLEPEAD